MSLYSDRPLLPLPSTSTIVEAPIHLLLDYYFEQPMLFGYTPLGLCQRAHPCLVLFEFGWIWMVSVFFLACLALLGAQ